jgi:hypothetical protein
MKAMPLLLAALPIALIVGLFASAGRDEPESTARAEPIPAERSKPLPADHPSLEELHARTNATASEPIQVELARGSNGKRIATVHAERESLAGSRVRVRGLVVKTTAGIRGVSYSHLQDGSGSPARGDHDLTVTSQAELNKGEVVTVEGTLKRDVDLGAGYRYPVLLADAECVEE